MLANSKNSWNSDIILVEDVFRPYFLSTVNLSYHKIDNANGLLCFSLTLFLPPCIQLWSIKQSIFLSVPEHRRSTRFHKHRCLQFQLCDTKRWRRIQNDGHIIVLLRLRPSTLFIFPFVFFFFPKKQTWLFSWHLFFWVLHFIFRVRFLLFLFDWGAGLWRVGN